MKLIELMEILVNANEIRLIQDNSCLYEGFMGVLKEKELWKDKLLSRNPEVKNFRCKPEIFHKKWREMGLKIPMATDQTPDYEFKDLEMHIYYEIYLKGPGEQ